MLAEHLEDLLTDPACRDEIVPLLPPHIKACLLAVARLRRLLCDAALLALADAGQAVLDLHGCGGRLSDEGIRAALRRMPSLTAVDLQSCAVGADTLRTLGECCPSVEALRLGSPATDESAGRGLRAILPLLSQRQAAPAAESWDSLLTVADDAAAFSAAVAGGGRLLHLRSLAWPNIPYRLQQEMLTSCPAVALNPGPEEAARLPPVCDPATQLDAPLLAGTPALRVVDAWLDLVRHA